ncbi:uroporphyrinogen-III synthase [Flavobacterium covae]|uniref:uroporphyrinogen-III synthase n=1 Tax=Flavobacterium covae TaxID=2906076 RepID=UPI000745E229|nr:uroporphyrinogen-III synthase [Flavobacterium covae]AMA50369.1 uroporphyrinogen III synthase [Flavobacterium covae]MCJ1808520.1 uroporphyrinogen-III synthase [Flavobacterium covae]
MKKTRILSTKKLLPKQKQLVLDLNIEIIDSDFINIKTKNVSIKELTDALIFTSQNAVLAVLNSKNINFLKSKKIFCVGIKTKTLLEKKGFIIESYANYAEELAKTISLNYSNLSYTFFSGNLRQDIVPKKLKEFGITLKEIEVYETILIPQKNNIKSEGILFYSPSGVESYLKENKITDEICFCIGNTTAKALRNITQKIEIADQPSVENVIIKCINYYKNTSQV